MSMLTIQHIMHISTHFTMNSSQFKNGMRIFFPPRLLLPFLLVLQLQVAGVWFFFQCNVFCLSFVYFNSRAYIETEFTMNAQRRGPFEFIFVRLIYICIFTVLNCHVSLFFSLFLSLCIWFEFYLIWIDCTRFLLSFSCELTFFSTRSVSPFSRLNKLSWSKPI